ncbi:uncharacterized protein HMPREF1541_01837 [Cyphellophora europaea CBS 101466]|uniref:Enoyl reductase (ER) domain-containing protein n=1 Tax=Cyphellophora europaea (strain CBS 101466) TaxID=1220924 RepID=W2S266_CYPE1|nr:uncharacterized protein HMPREF1541_01837 [Cyphellophora europaea CBS 101466]ETN42680.1 hypothetical protein HMPREF1541_01837 [Cyphellophora europaea CBS 101466]
MSKNTVPAWTATTPGYPGTLQLSEHHVPSTPSKGHVLVEIHAAALNPVDIQIMNLPINSLPGLRGPKVVGREFSGIVIAAAPGVPFQKGDKVMGIDLNAFASGFLTTIAHIDTRKTCIIPKPQHMTWIQAACLPLAWLTARSMIEKCAPFMKSSTPSHNKLVVLGGSSASGIYTIKIAAQRGWTVLSSCSGRNADFVKSLGAAQIVDYTSAADAVATAVAAFQPDAIVDCVGGTACVGLAPQYVTIVGDKTSRATLGGSLGYMTNPRMVLRWLLGYLGLGKSYQAISLEVRPDWLQEAAKLEGEDQIVVDSVFAFDRVDEGFKKLDTGRARGKVVIEVVPQAEESKL